MLFFSWPELGEGRNMSTEEETVAAWRIMFLG